jgi:biopolymer transport protein ExbD
MPRKSRPNQLPEVNLVPMMDVLMTVLTFFILISMIFSQQQGVEAPLPAQDMGKTQTQQPDQPDPLFFELDATGKIFIEKKPVSSASGLQQVKLYLNKYPKGKILLKPDPKVPYEMVVDQLGQLRDLAGDRVALAVDNP